MKGFVSAICSFIFCEKLLFWPTWDLDLRRLCDCVVLWNDLWKFYEVVGSACVIMILNVDIHRCRLSHHLFIVIIVYQLTVNLKCHCKIPNVNVHGRDFFRYRLGKGYAKWTILNWNMGLSDLIWDRFGSSDFAGIWLSASVHFSSARLYSEDFKDAWKVFN